ncbi:hypothetical protein M3Y94_01230500 [Aphelenchoides besseyi]|nr:hypothetical protein M3Y94_01230500 [Aphelenchoides besseyi]KAI6219628.1 hypothetical protein M3Y95_01086900 [Aphelenchoides besseyi]
MSVEEVVFSLCSYVLLYFLLPVVSACLLQLLCSKSNRSRIKTTRTAVQPLESLTQKTSAAVEKPIEKPVEKPMDQNLGPLTNTPQKNVNLNLVKSSDQMPKKESDEEPTDLCTPKWMDSGPKPVFKNGMLVQELSKKTTKN